MGNTHRILALGTLFLGSACANEGIVTARADMEPLVDAACDWMYGCCSTNELVYQVGDFTVDATDCSERMLDAIEAGAPLQLQQGGLSNTTAQSLLVLAQSINAGRVTANREAVQACAQATLDRTCNQPVVITPAGRCTPTPAVSPVNPCDPQAMFTGRQRAGEACDGTFECEGGMTCLDFGIGGVCSLPSGQGETCFSDNECGDELLCDWVRGICVRGAQSGESCAYADPEDPIPGTETIRCATGLLCDVEALICTSPFCVPGAPCGDIFDDSDCPEATFCVRNDLGVSTCQMPGDLGDPCTKAADCTSAFCDPGLAQCGMQVGIGSDCSNDLECTSGFCDFGLCEASVPAGQPCPSFDSSECQGGFCDTSLITPLCRAFVAEGAACVSAFECDPEAELQCAGGRCLREPFANGTTCFSSFQCESQICFMGMCRAGLATGSSCRNDGTLEPCTVGTYCEVPMGGLGAGTCADLRRPGEACDTSEQCWGNCVIRFGTQMCDTTTAFALDEVWCDGR